MSTPVEIAIGIATALGAGLLIGVERERRKGAGRTRGFAGARSFALASLAGALAAMTNSAAISAVVLASVAALAVVSHWRDVSGDPGVTTEIALIATTLIGMLAMTEPAIAAAIAIVIAALLLLRARVQHFAKNILSEQEVRDAIVLLGLTLILLPLVPDRTLSDWIPLNPHRILRLVVIMSSIQALGYVMLRTLGHRVGVPLAGLISGFISSTATHAAMGTQARTDRANVGAYVSAAAFSSVATAVQALVIVATIAPARLSTLLPYLIALALGAVACGLLQFRSTSTTDSTNKRRAFNLWHAFVFALLLSSVSTIAAMIEKEWGETAGWVTAVLAALVDVHVAIAALVAQPAFANESLALPVLICVTVNAAVKAVAAFSTAGNSSYFFRVFAYILAMIALPWLVYASGYFAH